MMKKVQKVGLNLEGKGSKTQFLLVSITVSWEQEKDLIKLERGCRKEYWLLKWHFYCSAFHHFAAFCTKHPSFHYFMNTSIFFFYFSIPAMSSVPHFKTPNLMVFTWLISPWSTAPSTSDTHTRVHSCY